MTKPETPAAIAAEIADECAALSRRARAVGLDTLGYLLDLARIEAEEAGGSAAAGDRL